MSKIERDKETIRLMVEMYCSHHLHQKSPSDEYLRLIDYSCRHLDRCQYGEGKPACKDCPIHCYNPLMREKMREVMRWVGPRMILFSPRATFRHFIQMLRYKLHKSSLANK